MNTIHEFCENHHHKKVQRNTIKLQHQTLVCALNYLRLNSYILINAEHWGVIYE